MNEEVQVGDYVECEFFRNASTGPWRGFVRNITGGGPSGPQLFIEFDAPFDGHNGNGYVSPGLITSQRGYFVSSNVKIIRRAKGAVDSGYEEYKAIFAAQELMGG